jgi:hypothetical protein
MVHIKNLCCTGNNRFSEIHTKYIYKVVQILPGLFVCKQVTVCPGHI